MIILNDSFRRVNAKGGRVGGKHPLYPDAGRLVKADDFDSRFNFASSTTDPIVGFGVIRDVVDDTGDAQFGEWSDLGYNWENGINKWEIRRITVAIEVKSESQFVRQPNILFDIEIDAQGYREIIRTGSSIAELLVTNVDLISALENWNTASENWESLNELIIWSDAMYPPRTITDTASSLFGIRSNSYWFKDLLIRRTANLLLDLQSSSSFQLSVFGDWDTSVNNWQNLYTVWPTFPPRTITDTASASLKLSGNSTFYIDTVISRSATIAFDISASSSFTISTIFTRTSSSIIGIASSVSGQLISFSDWQTAGINWESTNTLWDTASTGQTITDTASSLIGISSNSSFLIDKLIKRTANVAFDINIQSINYTKSTIYTRSASSQIGLNATSSGSISTTNWETTSVQWQSQSLLWDTASTGYTITDTASASMSLKSSNIYSDFTYGWNTDTSNWENQSDTWPIVWTPTEITTEGWWDASDNTSYVVSGTEVTSVTDKSGNNYTLEPITSTESGPSVGTVTQNGLSVFEFDSTFPNNQILENNSFSWNQSSSAIVFAMVCRSDNDGTTDQDFFVSGTLTSNPRIYVRRTTDSRLNMFGGNGIYSANNLGEGQAEILILKFNGTTSSIKHNGTQVASGNIGTNSFSRLTIGGNFNRDQHVEGFIGEIIAFSDTTKIQIIEGYLAHKWGLVGNLPSNHPYKVSAP